MLIFTKPPIFMAASVSGIGMEPVKSSPNLVDSGYVREFNRNNPAIAITRSSLVQSVTGKYEREARYRRYGANIDEKAATIFAEEADPYR